MKDLLTLMRWDLVHLFRNQLVTVSFALALCYYGIFYLLKDLGDLDNFLILLIYNDPVVTGYIFAGVLLLFERNQHTLQALSVSPIKISHYLWSKAIVLSLLALLVGLFMVVAIHGWDIQYFHFSYGLISATLFSAFCGFAITANCTSFNSLLARSIPFLILFALPFLGVFNILTSFFWYFIPSYAGIILIKASLQDVSNGMILYAYIVGTLCVILSYYLALSIIKKNLSK